MYLQKLEIQGFKSFANKTVLEFSQKNQSGKSVSAVVGPNGSGKSNIADAVRWVLGEQSLKLLRGKKSEDIIFSGSPKKPRMGFAEVSLYLNNEDGKAPVDYQEVVLTRRFYRNGEGEYLINKNKVRLSDVLLFLAQANFGQKTYSIIGQGMVDAILLATPMERKEFFDEATGVEQYQIKKNQALNKLKASGENLGQAEALFAEIEPRVRSLTRQMKRLEQRGTLERELKEIQKKYYSHLWREIASKIRQEENKVDPLLSKKEELEALIAEAENKLRFLEKEQPTSNLFREFQEEYEKLFEEKNRLRERDMIIKNKIVLSQHVEIGRPIAMSLEEIEGAVENFLKKYEEFVKKLVIAKTNEDLSNIKKEAESLRNELRSFFAELRKPATKKASAVDPALEKELSQIAGDVEKINRALTEVQVKIDNFNHEQEAERKNFFDLQRNLQQKQHELYLLTSKINEIQVEGAGMAARKEDLEREIRQEWGDPASLPEQASGFEADWPDRISRLKHQMELIGGIDPEIEKEYEETSERYEFLKTQITDLRQAISSIRKIIEELDEKLKEQFNFAFGKINDEFGKYFKILFGGGRAQLILRKEIKVSEGNGAEDGEAGPEEENLAVGQTRNIKSEEFISGVEIEATPPGKRLKGIGMLSGGERALTSIALLSAIIANNPAPFVVLDEVDAALDESNSVRFANILDELNKRTQFILITHNRATMQKADILYGVTMESDGVSRLLSLKLEEAEKTLAGY